MQGSCVFNAREYHVSRDAHVRKQNLRAWQTPRDEFGFLDWNIFIRGVIIQMKPMKWCNNIFDK